MSKSKLRRQIAQEAARRMYEQQGLEYHSARAEAAQQLCHHEPAPADLPTHNEIRVQIRKLAQNDPAAQRPVERPLRHTSSITSDDRFQVYEALLIPLENVRQNLQQHPEGDALYHSLQVFDHARDELPYDEEFLLAALLHDVGKAIDPFDPVDASLQALEGTITERTAWLIENLAFANALAKRNLASRTHRQLRQSEHYDDLLLLGECDRAGRQPGVEAPELEEALDYLRDLS